MSVDMAALRSMQGIRLIRLDERWRLLSDRKRRVIALLLLEEIRIVADAEKRVHNFG
jgi:hypothetical protein